MVIVKVLKKEGRAVETKVSTLTSSHIDDISKKDVMSIIKINPRYESSRDLEWRKKVGKLTVPGNRSNIVVVTPQNDTPQLPNEIIR